MLASSFNSSVVSHHGFSKINRIGPFDATAMINHKLINLFFFLFLILDSLDVGLTDNRSRYFKLQRYHQKGFQFTNLTPHSSPTPYLHTHTLLQQTSRSAPHPSTSKTKSSSSSPSLIAAAFASNSKDTASSSPSFSQSAVAVVDRLCKRRSRSCTKGFAALLQPYRIVGFVGMINFFFLVCLIWIV